MSNAVIYTLVLLLGLADVALFWWIWRQDSKPDRAQKDPWVWQDAQREQRKAVVRAWQRRTR